MEGHIFCQIAHKQHKLVKCVNLLVNKRTQLFGDENTSVLIVDILLSPFPEIRQKWIHLPSILIHEYGLEHLHENWWAVIPHSFFIPLRGSEQPSELDARASCLITIAPLEIRKVQGSLIFLSRILHVLQVFANVCQDVSFCMIDVLQRISFKVKWAKRIFFLSDWL